MGFGDSVLKNAYAILHRPGVRRWLERLPLVRRLYTGWWRQHPYDREFGTDTSGFMSVEEIKARSSSNLDITPYAGSQPSIVRRALQHLPPVNGYTFVDLGCGKGRPLLVASEFPFADIVGVDIAPELVKVAQQNGEVIRRSFPERTPIRAIEGNAFTFMPDSDRIVFFLYNSFPREGVEALVRGIEKRLSEQDVQIFLVSYNPVWATVPDASPRMARYSAELYAYDASELGYGPDLADTVIVWQSVPEKFPPLPGADRGVRLFSDGWHAKLDDAKAI